MHNLEKLKQVVKGLEIASDSLAQLKHDKDIQKVVDYKGTPKEIEEMPYHEIEDLEETSQQVNSLYDSFFHIHEHLESEIAQ